TYSPDGRIFQVEYAQKAADISGYGKNPQCGGGGGGGGKGFFLFLGGEPQGLQRLNRDVDLLRVCRTAIGLRVKDGVVLAVEKIIQSKLLVPGSNRRIQSVDLHAGIATAGLLADGRHVINRAREEAAAYKDTYRVPIPGKILADRVGQYVAAYTLYSSVRPFGISAIIGVVDRNGPGLFMVEPSGIYWV
ncbi:MAG: nucleophile aminohydrolase, partial [Olpidium bornovanus]